MVARCRTPAWRSASAAPPSAVEGFARSNSTWPEPKKFTLVEKGLSRVRFEVWLAIEIPKAFGAGIYGSSRVLVPRLPSFPWRWDFFINECAPSHREQVVEQVSFPAQVGAEGLVWRGLVVQAHAEPDRRRSLMGTARSARVAPSHAARVPFRSASTDHGIRRHLNWKVDQACRLGDSPIGRIIKSWRRGLFHREPGQRPRLSDHLAAPVGFRWRQLLRRCPSRSGGASRARPQVECGWHEHARCNCWWSLCAVGDQHGVLASSQPTACRWVGLDQQSLDLTRSGLHRHAG